MAKLKKKSTTKKPKHKLSKKIAKPKKKKVSAIPKGSNSITAYLIANNAKKAIEFYKKAFAAKELCRMEQPRGKIAHAELKIGDSKFMLADECPEMNALSPNKFGGCPITMHLYVKNVDETIKKAVKAGAKLLRRIEDMFYGDRCGMIKDPYGYTWYVATHIEDVSFRETAKRAEKLFGKKK